MVRTVRILILGGAAVVTAACSEQITASIDRMILDGAFTSTPLGFESAESSFSSSDGTSSAFMPDSIRRDGRGPNLLSGGHDFMGGGLGIEFLGGATGSDRSSSSSPKRCTFAASTGVVTCAPTTRNGITTTRTLIYKTTAGTAQAAQDSTTNSITTHTTVTGTTTRRDGSVTTVNHTSDRTVTGLVKASTKRTVNGTSAGTETTAGKDKVGAYTASRAIGDTTSGVITPVVSGKPTYPLAGSVIRSMKVTLTYAGKAPTISSRREVITYDGSATAKLVITQNGTTKKCTIALPRGKPICS